MQIQQTVPSVTQRFDSPLMLHDSRYLILTQKLRIESRIKLNLLLNNTVITEC